MILGFDTATSDTAVAVVDGDVGAARGDRRARRRRPARRTAGRCSA